MSDIQDPRRRLQLTFGSATSITSAIDLEGYRIAAINWSSLSSANLPMTFAVSQDGTSFFNLWDDAGSEVTIASGAFSTATPRSIVPGPTLAVQLGANRFVKLRLGTAASPSSNSATAYPFDLVLAPW